MGTHYGSLILVRRHVVPNVDKRRPCHEPDEFQAETVVHFGRIEALALERWGAMAAGARGVQGDGVYR